MGEFGWAYVVGGVAGGVSGSVQTATDEHRLTGSTKLVYDDVSGSLNLTGSLFVSGTITANQFNVNIVNKTVTNLSASGDTKFGDSTDDTHIFTGSILLSSSTNPLIISGIQAGSGGSSAHYLALNSSNQVVLTSSVASGGVGLIDEYTNPGSTRIITSIDSTGINAEANLLFDGSTLTVTGDLTASVGLSGSIGRFNKLSGSSYTDGAALITGGDISGVGTLTATSVAGTLTTPAQPNVTSLGTLTGLTASGLININSSTLYIKKSNERVGIGTAAPSRKVDVLNTAPQLRLSYSKYVLGVTENVYSELYTNSNGHLIMSSSGNRVGIGTTSPSRMLDVNGNMRVSGNLEISGTLSARVTDFVVSANNITFGDSATDTLTFKAATASIPNDLNFGSGLLSLDNTNSKVGIGVQYPDNKLEVLSTAAQLKLSYNPSNSTNFYVTSSGDLIITPTGLAITASSDFFVSGNTVLGSNPSDTVTVAGSLTSSVGFSGSYGQFTYLTASNVKVVRLTDGTALLTGGNLTNAGTVAATNLGGTLTTAAQPNVTSLGTLIGLTGSGYFNYNSNTLVVKESSTRVGIGTNAPSQKLEVLSTSPQLRLSYQKYTGFGTQNIYSEVYTDSSGYLIISGSGQRVGIGTSSPQAMLDVSGNVRIWGDLNITGTLRAKVSEFIVDANNITFGDSATDTLIFNAATGTVMNGLNWDSDTFVMDSDQNRIGIGVPAPQAKLHVQTSTQDQLRLAYNNSTSTRFTVQSTGDMNIQIDGSYITASSGFKVSGSTFLGSLSTQHTVVSGDLSASVAVSSSLGRFTTLTASTITDGTATITGGDISGVGTLTATNLGGTLTTAAQGNVTSLGALTGLTVNGDVNFNSNSLFAKSSNGRIGIGRNDPVRALEVLKTTPQLRLSYSKYVFGVTDNVYSDLYTDSSGYLILTSSGERIGIGTTAPTALLAISGAVHISASSHPLKLLGLKSGSLAGIGSYLGVNASGMLVLTSSATGSGGGGGTSGIYNRRVVSATVTASATDYYIGISASTNVIIQLLDASSMSDGQTLVIKDEKGTADSLEFFVKASGSQLIDGTGSVRLESPYTALNLYTNGVDKYFIF